MSTNGEYLTPEDIFGQDDLKKEEVEVDRWGGKKVVIRELNARQKLELAEMAQSDEGLAPDTVLKMIGWALVDPKDGSRLLTDEQVEQLGNKSWEAVEQVSQAVIRMNGLGEEDTVEEGKAAS
jgi:hypothetical protein